jgi:hypothetical protein
MTLRELDAEIAQLKEEADACGVLGEYSSDMLPRWEKLSDRRRELVYLRWENTPGRDKVYRWLNANGGRWKKARKSQIAKLAKLSEAELIARRK